MDRRLLFVWFQAFRPKTLVTAVVPILVGTALVFPASEPVLWHVSLFALLSAACIQVGTNLVNDAIDFKKGADTEERIGPRRVTQSGLITSRRVMLGGFLAFALAMAFGVPLVIQGGWVIVMIGLVSLFLGYSYTGGFFPLAYLGLGDLFVVIFFGLVAVGGVYYLHTLNYAWDAVVAGLQVGFLATVLIAINNLRDVHQDTKVNKKTMAVRFGPKLVRFEIALLFFSSFLLCGYWVWKGAWLAAVLPLVAWPLALTVIRGVYRNEPGPVYNQFLGQAAAVHMIFGFQLSLGLWLA